MVFIGIPASIMGSGTYQLCGVVAWCAGFLLMGLSGILAKMDQVTKQL